MKDNKNEGSEIFQIGKEELENLKETHKTSMDNNEEVYSYKGKLLTIQEGNILIKFIESLL